MLPCHCRGRHWTSVAINWHERMAEAIKPCRMYLEKKCGRVTERRGRAAGGSKSAAGAIRELFGHSINNERWKRRWPSTPAAVSTEWGKKKKKNERRAVFNLYLEMHNCIKYYNWFLTSGWLFNWYFTHVKFCVISCNRRYLIIQKISRIERKGKK